MKFYYLIIFFLFHQISSNLITIKSKKEVKSFCDDGLYIIEIKVDFSSPFNNYYSFNLKFEDPFLILFKCFLSYSYSKIICSANLNSNKIKTSKTEILKFPNSFPIIKGFLWDYDTFVKNIYEKEIILGYNCQQKNIIKNKDDWDFIFNITSVYDNKCTYSKNEEENKYAFNMKVTLLEGILKKKLENEVNNFGFHEYEFLQEIWVPITIGDASNENYIKNNDFPFAFCSSKEKISNDNFKSLKKEGFELECYIPIPDEQLMTGIIQIRPFFDQMYLRINSDISNNNITFSNLYFEINRTIEIIENNLTSITLRNIEEISDNITEITSNNEETGNISDIILEQETQAISIIEKNEKNFNLSINESSQNSSELISNNHSKFFKTIDYLLIGDNSHILYCPDKPIFTMEEKKDIQLKLSSEKNYTFFLRGKLSFKFHIGNNEQMSSESSLTKEDISFNLQVKDNLAENEDNQKSIVNCTIPKNTDYLNKRIYITCYGNKISEESMKNNDTDITLNWGVDKNRIHENIIIKWPKNKKRIKHMYSYTIKAFSLMQKNYGCFNNDFYFYMYIYNLDSEPDILFKIKMENPKVPKAVCKIYESSILKCYFPLYHQRIKKDSVISMPTNITYESIDTNGNKVIFTVDDYPYDYEDFHIISKETCGDYVFIGALRRAGLSYLMIIIGIGGTIIFILSVFICFICFVKYKIKHRSRKGQYFAHVEEGDSSGIRSKKMRMNYN